MFVQLVLGQRSNGTAKMYQAPAFTCHLNEGDVCIADEEIIRVIKTCVIDPDSAEFEMIQMLSTREFPKITAYAHTIEYEVSNDEF